MLSKIKFSDYFKEHRTNNFFLTDTDILSDIAKDGKSKEVSQILLEKGSVLLYSLPSIMELGFAPDNFFLSRVSIPKHCA